MMLEMLHKEKCAALRAAYDRIERRGVAQLRQVQQCRGATTRTQRQHIVARHETTAHPHWTAARLEPAALS